MKNCAVLSSGTDNSGINSAIRSIVRMGKRAKTPVYGVKWGFRGLLEDDIAPLTSRDVSGKMGKAGCFLGTARPEGTLEPDKIPKIMANLQKRKINSIIVIGGKTSLTMSQTLAQKGIQIVGIPSTIQDDIVGTDIALGVDSAVNTIARCVEVIRSCDSSRNRTFLVQVEGKTCGSLALRSAVVTGSELCLIPEHPMTDLSVIAKQMAQSSLKGKTQFMTIISAGWKPGSDVLADYLKAHISETDLLVRESVFGYVQRGGSPSAYDRILGTEMGVAALDAIRTGLTSTMIGVQNGKLVNVPYSAFLGKMKKVDNLYDKLLSLN